ncbi:MAG: tRNA lysidine(34) synthetase TilS [Dehalococcoidia bacterium]|nr:tRNA lysidine(34) synthetase TilS [Dehalococcoidia bacterium]
MASPRRPSRPTAPPAPQDPQDRALVNGVARRVERGLRAAGLAPGGSLILAVSGGPDSLTLAHALWHLREPLNLTLYGAHMDHGIRGKEGAEDALFVQYTLRQAGIPTFVRKVRLREDPQAPLPSEAAARHARYRFFAELSQEVHADAVALGHTADDQAETVLLHLVRGTGIAGLAGMQTLSTLQVEGLPVRLFRPLLDVPREETHRYCEVLQLNPRQDSTNLSLVPLRNRLRLELLPMLEEYNPAIREALGRLAHAATREVAFLDQRIQEVWPQVVREEAGNILLDRKAFAALNPAVQSHLLRLAYAQLREGTPQGLEQIHVEEMMEQMSGPSGRSAHLPGGVTFFVEFARALLTRDPRPPRPAPSEEDAHPLTVPGTTRLPGWTVVAEQVSPDTTLSNQGEHQAILDMDVVGPRLFVRTRLQGDRFQPLGMEEEKRLQDFLVDAKVPGRLRTHIPLVIGDRGIVWVLGYRIAHWARLTPKTRKALRLTFQPVP